MNRYGLCLLDGQIPLEEGISWHRQNLIVCTTCDAFYCLTCEAQDRECPRCGFSKGRDRWQAPRCPAELEIRLTMEEER